MRRCTQQDDAGFVAAEWMVGLALIVLPTMLLVGLLPGWASRHAAAGVAAREAARAAASAATVSQAEADAIAMAEQVLTQRGFDVRGTGVRAVTPTVAVAMPVADPGGLVPRVGDVIVRVTLVSPTITLPAVGDVTPPAVTGEHHRRLDDWRTR